MENSTKQIAKDAGQLILLRMLNSIEQVEQDADSLAKILQGVRDELHDAQQPAKERPRRWHVADIVTDLNRKGYTRNPVCDTCTGATILMSALTAYYAETAAAAVKPAKKSKQQQPAPQVDMAEDSTL